MTEPITRESLEWAFAGQPINRRTLLGALAALGVASATGVQLSMSSSAAAATYIQYRLPFPTHPLNRLFGVNGHMGTDFGYGGVSAQDWIPAIASGVVTRNSSTQHTGLGWRLEIKHADGKFSGYAHMFKRSSLAVGTSVTRGDPVGQVGETGNWSDGNHLHLTMASTEGNAFNNVSTFDPLPYIQARLAPAPPESEDQDMAIFLKTAAGSDYVYHLYEEFNFTTFATTPDATNFGDILPNAILITATTKAFLEAHAIANRSTLVQEVANSVAAALAP